MVEVKTKAFRSNEVLNKEVTRNFVQAIDYVVGKTGPVKGYGQAAELVGLNGANLSRIQNGERNVPLEAAVRACDVFGISYSYMFGSVGEMFAKDDIVERVLALEERVKKLEKGKVKK